MVKRFFGLFYGDYFMIYLVKFVRLLIGIDDMCSLCDRGDIFFIGLLGNEKFFVVVLVCMCLI